MNINILKPSQKVTLKNIRQCHYGGSTDLMNHFGSEPATGVVTEIQDYDSELNCFTIRVRWDINSIGEKFQFNNYRMLEKEFVEFSEPESNDFKPGDIVKIKNPYADTYRFGGISIAKTSLIAAGIGVKDWRARVESVCSESILVHFLDIVSGYYKFSRDEIYKSTETPSILGGTCTLNSITIPPGKYSLGFGSNDEFKAQPSGYVETLNEDMPLFSRTLVTPNRVPDDI